MTMPNAILQGFLDQMMLFNRPRNAKDSLSCLQNSTIVPSWSQLSPFHILVLYSCNINVIVLILTVHLLSKLSPYTDEITGGRQCGFRRNRSTTDQMFCICRILEEKWEYNETVHQLFVDIKKACDSVRREVMYNILIEFGIPMKLDMLIKLCLKETYSEVRIVTHLSDNFPIQNGLKQGDDLSPLFSTLL
jgi:hypothetical protein